MITEVVETWMSYRDRYVTVLLRGNMPTSKAFTIANRAADLKFGKRIEPTLPVEKDKPDSTTRRARKDCKAIMTKLLLSGVFKDRKEMNRWASEHIDSPRKRLRVSSFTLEECNALLARLKKLERM